MMTIQSSIKQAIYKLVSTNKIESATEIVKKAFSECTDIKHVSVWGYDSNSRRVFFAYNIINIVDIPPLPISFIYENDVLGILNNKCDEETTIIPSSKLPGDSLMKELLNNKTDITPLLIRIPVPDQGTYFAIILSEKNVSFSIDRFVPINVLLKCFIQSVSRIKSEQFATLMGYISREKAIQSGLQFLENTCALVAQTFSADSFSLWLIENNKLVGKYFSDGRKPTSSLVYDLGEGLTGFVAKKGIPIMCHTLTDAKELYGAVWKGKISDFAEKPNKNDHIIIIPLIFPSAQGRPPQVKGVIRFTSKASRPTFWPMDFERAKDISRILSVWLYQDILLDSFKQQKDSIERNNEVRKDLLDCMFRARAGLDFEDIIIDVLDLMRNWDGIYKAAIIDSSINFDSTDYSFLSLNLREKVRGILENNLNSKYDLSDEISIWPIRSETDQYGILIVKFDKEKKKISSEWVHLVSLFLNSYYSIQKLFEEKERLRSSNEEKELNALAGVIARQFAHEVRNACKAIDSWIKLARKKSPNYQALTQRVNELNQNIEKLINSTGHAIQRKECDFINEILNTLKILGIRHNTKRDGCTILFDIEGYKHRKVFMDPATLIGIMNNLILNSVEQYKIFDKTGPIEISIIDKTEIPDDHIGVSVKDYAVGIQESNINEIFVDGFTTKPEGGKGLGLSIVKHLTEACDGEIKVKSVYGHYAQFIIFYRIL